MADPADHASKTKGLAWLLGAGILALLLAIGISPAVRRIPWPVEIWLGRTLIAQPQACEAAPGAAQQLQKLTTRLFPLSEDDRKIPFNVTITDDTEVNAYALLGGHIIVTSGLLRQAESADEIAGVLAHELGHVHQRHIIEGFVSDVMLTAIIAHLTGSYSSISHDLLQLHFTSAQETRADRDGLERLQRAHISNQGLADFFTRMDKQGITGGFLTDHPANSKRLALIAQFPGTNTQPVMDAASWKILQAYCLKQPAH